MFPWQEDWGIVAPLAFYVLNYPFGNKPPSPDYDYPKEYKIITDRRHIVFICRMTPKIRFWRELDQWTETRKCSTPYHGRRASVTFYAESFILIL
jgi:hypothetical protein